MARGNYTFEEIKRMDADEILYLNHYQELNIQLQQDFLTNALGVMWDKKNFTKQVSDTNNMTKKNIDRLFLPLSVAVNPQVIDYVNEQFGIKGQTEEDGSIAKPYIGGGTYTLKEGETVKSLAELDKEDFMRAVGGWGMKSNVSPHPKKEKPHEGSFTPKPKV